MKHFVHSTYNNPTLNQQVWLYKRLSCNLNNMFNDCLGTGVSITVTL